MHQYRVRDIEKLLRLPRRAIHALIKAGFVVPERGPRNSYLFSFQDLILLRTAQSLAVAKVPAKRITKSLKALRRQIPETIPLSGVAISAVGDRVVVKEGGSRRLVESGQYVLAFDGGPAEGSMTIIERKTPAAGNAEDWFEKGYALESDRIEAAREAYGRAVAADPTHISANLNLGRLLLEAGCLDDAEQTYRNAIAAGVDDPRIWYNLGVLLTNMNRKHEALEAYDEALHLNPCMADCHYNMALLFDELKKYKKAMRHMAQYRRLVDKP